MADGHTGDSAATKPVDQPASNQSVGSIDGHIAKLLADSQAKPGDSTTAKDNTQDVVKLLDSVKETTEKPAVEAFSHLTNAQMAANEIAGYVNAGKKETDTVTVKGLDGADHTVNVGDRVKELKKIVDSEGATAVGQSSNINQAEVAQLLQAARNERNAAAKDLQLDPDKVSATSIDALIKNTTDSGTALKLDKLKEAQAIVDNVKLWENGPAYTRMLYSSFKANGLTDPDSGMQKDKNGGLKASQKDVLDAVHLLTEAGTNKDLRNSKLYVAAVNTVFPKLENSSAKVQTITTDLQGATAAGAKGNKVEQERLLKDAVAQADTTNTATIAQMLRDPRFVQSQRDPAVLTEMGKSVIMGNTARLQYAQFLIDQGKMDEAQGLVLRVKSEVPQLIATPDPKDPTKLVYTNSSFVDMAKLDHAMNTPSTMQPNQISNLLDDLSSKMSKGQIETKDGVKGAKDVMTDLFTVANKNVADTTAFAQLNQKGLDAAQKQLDQEKADLPSKKFLTDGAKALEQQRLDREQALIQQQKTVLAADVKEANRLLNVVKIYDAQLDVSEDKRDAARSRLAEVKASDPALAAEKGPDGQDSPFAKLEKASQEPSWWDRNWRKVAWTGAAVLGVAAGAATFYLGPGAVGVGVGTTAGLATWFGLGVAAGAVVGGTTFLGTHEALYHTGEVTEKVDAARDFEQGAGAGGLGSFAVLSLPAMAGIGAISTAGAGTEGAVQVASWGARALTTGAVFTPASTTFGVADYYSKDPAQRSVLGEVAQVAPMVVAPMLFNSASLKLASATPRLFSAGNLSATSLGVLSMPAARTWLGANSDRKLADQLGPAYAFGEDGKIPSTTPNISQSTSIFSPYNATRGWQANRQPDGDYTGERSIIQSNWIRVDPGVEQTDAVSTEQLPASGINTGNDFSDASKLDGADKPKN